jgi:hypothetical protein
VSTVCLLAPIVSGRRLIPKRGTESQRTFYSEEGWQEVVDRKYDMSSEKIKREDRFDFPKTGGLKVGAKSDEWWRKSVREFDVATGKVSKEETFRYDDTQEPAKRWVKVAP